MSASTLHRQIRCIHDSKGAVAGGASRCYGTVAGASADTKSPLGSTASDLPYRPKRRKAAAAAPSIESTLIKKADGTPLYVPSVRLSPAASKAPSVHKIHILGEDARSKFIAHALSGVYDSVERLAWRKPSNKYRNFQRYDKAGGKVTMEPLLVTPQLLANQSDAHIDELVVSSDSAQGAFEALESVKHRIDQDTTVCLMSEGLGVLEDVRQKIFSVPENEPTFLLGHMSHKFVYNRNFDSVRQLRTGLWNITSMQPGAVMSTSQPKIETQPNFVKTLQQSKLLRTEYTQFDSWFQFKLPGIMFDTAVEPVCLLLDIPYSSILTNAHARKLINNLLQEILLVVRQMPEIGRNEKFHQMMDVERAKKALYHRIVGKKTQESSLVRDIRRGLPVNVDYLNGYFLRRAYTFGTKMPTNKMMLDLVKAKHAIAMQNRDAYIPIEETSMAAGVDEDYKPLSRY